MTISAVAENRHSLNETDICRRWRPALVSFFLRRVRDEAEAEDLAQETILRALKSNTPVEQLDGYVFRIAQNLLVDRARRLKVRDNHSREVLTQPDMELHYLDPERIAQGRQEIARLIMILEELPERTRAIFMLYRLENMTQDEIGQAFGISAAAVKQHVAKVMATLARRMRDSE